MMQAGRAWIGCAAALLLSGGAATPQDAGPAGFLGFDPGEEIRYALEMEGATGLGIVAHWSIRLEEIEEDGSAGVFDLSYLAGRPGRTTGDAQLELNGATSTTARAWINARGFPLRLRFLTQRNTAEGDVQYAVEYRHDEDRFRKELDAGGLRDEQNLDLDDVPGVDPRAAHGLYLFTPIDAACLLPAVPVASVPPGDRGESEDPCRGRELAFGNPGLLNLVMPDLWETGSGGLAFAALAPTGVREELFADAGSGRSAGNVVSFSGIPLSAFFGPDVLGPSEDALARMRLQADGDLVELDVGGRRVDAWKLAAAAPLEAVWVDGAGSIVRLDLPPDPDTGDRLYIRRLRPSEY